MTLTELRYIIALNQTGHFGKAAEKCSVSQPTLSVAVKKLEEELDIALFERSRHQVRPTPLGEKIIAQAQTVLEQASRIQDLADSGKDPLGSPLAIGAIFTVGPYLFPNLIPHLQTSVPKMPLYIEENYTAVLREKLKCGELDVIVIALPFNEVDVVTKPIYEEPFVVLLPHHHPLADCDSVSAKQLMQETVLLLGEGHCFRDQVLAACPGLKKQLQGDAGSSRSVVEGSSLETLKYMVASGLGITVLPQSAALPSQLADGKLTTRPLATNPQRTVALAWRASFPRHQAIDALCDGIAHTQTGRPTT